MSLPAPLVSRVLAALVALVLVATPAAAQDLSRQVEILRTDYGIPHIMAETLEAAAFGLAWVQLEDHGDRVPRGMLRARGELARYMGPDYVDSDFLNRMAYARALATYHLVDADTRAVYDGFAAGVNRYLELHPQEIEELPKGLRFNGHDVHALSVGPPAFNAGRRVIARLEEARRADERPRAGAEGAQAALLGLAPAPAQAEDGSNAWAFHPSRTKSGEAILLRNPHLSWTAGYYEAHLVVPGVLNFYGDFRIGGPFGIIGGFNERLGWATTNNDVDPDEVYALDVDPDRTDHYLFDGGSVPLRRELVTVEFANGEGLGTATREFWTTPLGPVIHRANGKIYVARVAGDGEFRVGEQFLRMMKARDLEEWKAAMRMLARGASNFTYADADGNIFYVWNGTVPVLPHAPGGDTLAIPARDSDDVWTRLLPWDSLPQLRNPRGGYIHQENDSYHFTNLNEILDASDYPPNVSAPEFDLRSQHAVELVSGSEKLSLEEVVRLKHSYGMLLADRVKDDLLAAVRAANPTGDVARAAELLERWDNTVAPESRGGVLFETWWRRYGALVDSAADAAGVDEDSLLYAEPWTAARPTETPRGLGRPDLAAAAFPWAVEETARRFGAFDVAWGDVHRVRRGSVDVPVGGCSGSLGCFRVLNFDEAPDGKRVADGGDGWVLAVEFTSPPRAYTVLAYGQSPDESSPHHADQAAMFARGEMKEIVFSRKDIEASTIRRYRPGVAGAASR